MSKLEIIEKEFSLRIYGFSGIGLNKNYTETAFKLMGRMWEIVKSRGIKNKGVNVWVYENGDRVFAGVELDEVPPADTGLELKEISLMKYAYYKHIGPYSQIRQVCTRMGIELKEMGFESRWPLVEIYGHWDPDESKLETEILMSLK